MKRLFPIRIDALGGAFALCLALLLAGCGQERPNRLARAGAPAEAPAEAPAGSPERGALAIKRYGCVACHSIPGAGGHNANVGPPLFGLSKRGYIGGVIANTPENLAKWIRNPPAIDPLTAMPNLGVTEGDAWDIVAYLYQHT